MSGAGEAPAKRLYPDEDQEVLDAIATRASSHAGVGAKLVELAAHQGWFATPDYYQTRLIHSALADLRGLEGRT